MLAGFGGCKMHGEWERDPDAIDLDDDRTLRPIELAVTDTAVFDVLHAQELTYQGPFKDSNGKPYITVFTTGAHARSLAQHGFIIRGIAAPQDSSSIIAYGPACSLPPSCSTPTGSDYFRSYDAIVDELQALASSSSAIRVESIGQSQKDGRPIMAIQFGPAEPPQNVPTVYVLATYHAREWLTTAVSLQLIRWLGELTISGTINGDSDPSLALALQYASIVIVPVVNPDGYEYSRNGYRSWRGNLNTDDCVGYGVDLNRNHTTAWDEPAPFPYTETTCGAAGMGTWRGPMAGSESETQAIEGLLIGEAFMGQLQRPVALISYHSYADLLIYPDGYKRQSNSQGPRCGLMYDSNCFNPDFTVLRDLFGDTHSDLFVDDVSYLPTLLEFPYYRDHSRTILYGVSGDVNLHATYGPMPFLAVTAELASACFGFAVECDARADEVVRGTAADQLDVIRRILPIASTLASTNPATAYGPNMVGTLSSGLWTREYQPNLDSEAVRATFTKSVFIPKSTGSLKAEINNKEYDYGLGRRGSQYELYYLRPANHDLDPLCLPCEIGTTSEGIEGENGDSALDCSTCVDLCDSSRLSASGWEPKSGDRGGVGKKDCWWTATGDNGELVIPGGAIPRPDTTHCHFTFSALWGPLPASKIFIERESSTGWETLQAVSYSQPYYGASAFPSNRLVSYAFEANNFLSSGYVPKFRLRVAGTAPGETVRVFDPVIYCRYGALP